MVNDVVGTIINQQEIICILNELKQIVIEDVPHKYQGRLLECLKGINE